MSLCCLVHLSGSVVRILLDYVSHVHICPKLRLTLEKQAEWPEICDVLGEFVHHFMTDYPGRDTNDPTDIFTEQSPTFIITEGLS